MKLRCTFVVTTLLLITFGEAYACSCAWRGSFVDYAKQSDGVVRARVAGFGERLSHGETLFASMTIQVITVVKGDFGLDEVVLLGDPGHLCRDYVDSRNFEIGKEYLFALHGDEAVQPFGGCGEAWLRIDNGVVSGRDWVDGDLNAYRLLLQDLLIKIAE